MLEARIHELVNHVRQVYGLPPLGKDNAPASIARAHSREMAARQYFGHINDDGLDATARSAEAGYTCHRNNVTY